MPTGAHLVAFAVTAAVAPGSPVPRGAWPGVNAGGGGLMIGLGVKVAVSGRAD